MVKVSPWWFIWLPGFYSSDLHIPTLHCFSRNSTIIHFIVASYLSRFSSVIQSSQFSQEAFEVLYLHSPFSNWQATMKTHTSQCSFCSHAWFAVQIPELVFTSVTGCLSSLLLRSPAGYPKQYQPCNGEKGSFLPKVLVAKSQTTEWNIVCQSPNWRNK